MIRRTDDERIATTHQLFQAGAHSDVTGKLAYPPLSAGPHAVINAGYLCSAALQKSPGMPCSHTCGLPCSNKANSNHFIFCINLFIFVDFFYSLRIFCRREEVKRDLCKRLHNVLKNLAAVCVAVFVCTGKIHQFFFSQLTRCALPFADTPPRLYAQKTAAI